MTKSYSTKRSLITSVIALMLCFSMLLGTTFAWFTDSVTSANNIIKSGNLDIELRYKNDEVADWTEVKDDTNVFKKDTLWEPGHVEVVKLKITNAGTLALKYQLGVNVVNEVTSINVNDGTLQLSEHIKYGILEGDLALSRSEAIAAVEATAKALKESYTSEDIELLPKTDNEDIVTLVVYMPETVGNEANYKQGEAVPTIDLGINLFATQYASETDSFDEKYDEKASYEKGTIAKTNIISKAMTISNTDGVEILGENLAIKTGQLGGYGVLLGNNGEANLDTAYQFQPTLSLEEAALSQYKDWHADFVVYVDKDIPARSVALAGYYDLFGDFNDDKWVALTSDDPIDANVEIRLVEMLGATVSYEELSEYGNDGVGFLCGAMKLDDQVIGTTLTVELRLYEATGGSLDTETSEYITVGKYNYTFK